MKVCFVSIYPFDGYGGSNTYALKLTRQLIEHGIELTIVGPRTKHGQKEKIGDAKFVEIPILNLPLLRSFSFWTFLRSSIETLQKRFGFDIIHLNDLSGAFLGGITIPRVTTIHHSVITAASMCPSASMNWIKEFRVQRGFNPYFERRALESTNHIIAVSEFTKRSLISYYKLDPNIIDVVYSGVSSFDPNIDDTKVVDVRRKLNQGIILLYVGRPERRKAAGVLLDCFKEIVREYPMLYLVIVGPGNWRDQKLFVANNNLSSKVIFRGAVSSPEIAAWYKHCDAVILPSFVEGFGLSVVEGMSRRKPVIAPRMSGVRELIDITKGGFLVDPKKPQSIMDAIVNLIECRSAWQSMGRKNADAAQSLTWSETAEATIRVYRKCLAR